MRNSPAGISASSSHSVGDHLRLTRDRIHRPRHYDLGLRIWDFVCIRFRLDSGDAEAQEAAPEVRRVLAAVRRPGAARAVAPAPARFTRPRLQGASGVVAGRLRVVANVHPSRHHSHTFPCMSYKPQAFGRFRPTGCVLPLELTSYRRTRPGSPHHDRSDTGSSSPLDRRTPTPPPSAADIRHRPTAPPRRTDRRASTPPARSACCRTKSRHARRLAPPADRPDL